MKVKLFLKDPDSVYDSVREAVQPELPAGLTKAESKLLLQVRMDALHEKLKPWVKWQEYVTVEIDTDTGTAVVLPSC